MKELLLAYTVILLQVSIANCQTSQKDFPVIKGPYFGQKPPGNIPEIFAPGIVSIIGSNEFALSFSPDGNECYFNRNMKIMVSTLEAGHWNEPKPVTFSAGARAHEAFVTNDNTKVYWGWFKNDDYGMYYSERVKDGWSEPVRANTDVCYSLSSDAKGEYYITRARPEVIANVIIKDGKFVELIPIKGEIHNTEGLVNSKGFKRMAHPTISPDGSYMIFDVNGGSHSFVTFREKDGTWSKAVDLIECGIGKEFGLVTITRDGKYIFFSGNDDIYWVSSKIIEELRPK